MHAFFRLAVLPTLALSLVPLQTLAQVVTSGKAADPPAPMGKQLYDRACARCHGVEGRGDRPDVQLNAPLPNFARCAESAEETDWQWRLVIEKGGIVLGLSDQMPAYGDALIPAQVDSLLEYMRTFCTDKRWVRGELNFQRPLFTEKAYPENELVLSPRIHRNRNQRPSLTWTNLLERRVGPRTQLEFGLPLQSVDRFANESQGQRNAGIGDLDLGLKQVLVDSLPKRFIFSAGLEATVPTGESARGLGAGTVKFEPFVAIGKEVLGWILQSSLKFELPVDTAKSKPEIAYQIALGHSVYRIGGVRDIFPMIELTGSRELRRGEPTSLFLVPELRMPIDRLGRWAFALGPLIPITRRPNTRVGFAAYLLYEYGAR